MQRTATEKRQFEGSSAGPWGTTNWAKDTAASGNSEWRRERQMSSTKELSRRGGLLEVEHDTARRESERSELAREIAAQHERLHTLRAAVLEELTKQRRVTIPRWPSGPKVAASLVDEDEWWAKTLGKKKVA
jgi:hypothetical protein